MKSIRWTDMVDPVYTITGLMDIPESADIKIILITPTRLSITYVQGNAMCYEEADYELD